MLKLEFLLSLREAWQISNLRLKGKYVGDKVVFALLGTAADFCCRCDLASCLLL